MCNKNLVALSTTRRRSIVLSTFEPEGLVGVLRDLHEVRVLQLPVPAEVVDDLHPPHGPRRRWPRRPAPPRPLAPSHIGQEKTTGRRGRRRQETRPGEGVRAVR